MVVSRHIRSLAERYGADDIQDSWVGHKKFAVLYKGRYIHFGDNRYEDYTIHKDKERRQRYRARASKITNKHGQQTYKLKTTPNFWAYHVLW
jgi:hypothetical protein